MMSDDELARRQSSDLVEPGSLAQAAQAADSAAARAVFARYRGSLAEQTQRAHDADLGRWARYLGAVGIVGADCPWCEQPSCWAGVSWGLVEGFIAWQLREGYAAASIARALSTVRQYARQAARAGALDPDALRLIETVTAPAPRSRAARNRDAQREQTRRGGKKADAVSLSRAQAQTLKQQADTPRGRRDALLMCLLLDHGLRVSEVCDLAVTALDLQAGQMTFYRRKVDVTQTHALSRDTRQAARRYYDTGDAPAAGPLLRASDRQGELTKAGLSTRAVGYLVEELGERAGIDGLSPHDCRHYWATEAARRGIDPLRLQEAGGWASLTMPRRYVERAAIANAGMVDDEPEGSE